MSISRFVPAFATLLCLSVLAAHAEQGPTTSDLKAAYCMRLTELGMERTSINDFPNDPDSVKLFQQAQGQAADRIARLRKYLSNRSVSLEQPRLAAAMDNAKTDLDAAFAQAELCSKGGDLGEKQFGRKDIIACARRFEAAPRMESCQDMSFLADQ